jgi:hypothetical protein
MQKWREDFKSRAMQETQNLTDAMAKRDIDIQELMKDDKAIPEKYKNDPQFKDMSNRQIIDGLINANVIDEAAMKAWGDRAGFVTQEGYYTEKRKTFKFGSDSGSKSTKKPDGM